VSRRKLTPRDYAALNRGRALVVYPPDGGRAQVRTPTTRLEKRRRNPTRGAP